MSQNKGAEISLKFQQKSGYLEFFGGWRTSDFTWPQACCGHRNIIWIIKFGSERSVYLLKRIEVFMVASARTNRIRCRHWRHAKRPVAVHTVVSAPRVYADQSKPLAPFCTLNYVRQREESQEMKFGIATTEYKVDWHGRSMMMEVGKMEMNIGQLLDNGEAWYKAADSRGSRLTAAGSVGGGIPRVEPQRAGAGATAAGGGGSTWENGGGRARWEQAETRWAEVVALLGWAADNAYEQEIGVAAAMAAANGSAGRAGAYDRRRYRSKVGRGPGQRWERVAGRAGWRVRQAGLGSQRKTGVDAQRVLEGFQGVRRAAQGPGGRQEAPGARAGNSCIM
ncbi:hypothetical protein B0H13DRAFT_1850533 [Mycena leptocephala]|nr:hypothetical protein B0H13DRAFT_1850533 [Mycena leptocephala]